MSMRSYPISISGVVVQFKELDIKALAEEFAESLPLEPEANEDDTKEAVYDFLEMDEIDLSTGGHIIGAAHLSDDIEGDFYSLLTDSEKDISVHSNWLIFDLPRYPSLFQAAYQNKEDLLQQMKALYGAFIKDPDNFDWEGRLVRLDAVIYG